MENYLSSSPDPDHLIFRDTPMSSWYEKMFFSSDEEDEVSQNKEYPHVNITYTRDASNNVQCEMCELFHTPVYFDNSKSVITGGSIINSEELRSSESG